MKNKLSIFNPEHDLALANDTINFNPPFSAKKFAQDLAILPIWFNEDNCIVYDYNNSELWLSKLKAKFSQLKNKQIISDLNKTTISNIETWGWDKTTCNKIIKLGFDQQLLPKQAELQKIRQLSNRNFAIKAHNYIISEIKKLDNNFDEILSLTALEAKNLNDIENFLKKNRQIVMKAPWSGSGAGLKWIKNKISDSYLGWAKNILLKQNSIILEKQYNIVQNFALELKCENNKTEFIGYSLFNTEKGKYKQSNLNSNEDIIKILTNFKINLNTLNLIKQHIQEFLNTEIAPFYSGIIGVDMFLYLENSTIKIHPCVEINLRTTMGYVARVLFDNFINKQSQGIMLVENKAEKDFFYNDNIKKQVEYPLIIKNNKILKGYLSLHNITKDTNFRISIIIF